MIFHSGGFTTNLVLIICLDNKGQKNGTIIFNILDTTTEMCMMTE